MPPGMPDTCVKHIRRNMRTCLLKLHGELLDGRNCLQLLGALLQNLLEVFSWTGLCDVPRPNISHTEKRAGCCNTGFAPFCSCAGNFYRTWRFFAGIWEDCARGHITSRSQSIQSRLMGGAIANTSFDAWVEDESPCMLACSWMTL